MSERPTWASVHTFLVQLPETEFDAGRMVFPNGVVRVRGKVIAYPAGGERGSPADARPGEEFVFVKARPDEREVLLDEDPATFFVTPHYATAGGVIVRLSAVDPEHLEELLVDAWRAVAPKRVVKAYDQGGAAPPGVSD